MIETTVSTGRVLAKIYRDLNLKNPNWEEDAIEWIGEALAHIGVGTQLSKKAALIAVDNYVGDLPTDYFRFREIFYYKGAPDYTLDGLGNPVFPNLSNVTPLPLQHTSATAQPSLIQGKVFEFPDGFFLNNGKVTVTFERGILELIYYGMAVDANGYPMVPDDPSFMDAFLWYIMKQMMIGGWKHPNTEFGFEMAEQRWLKYCTQARSKAKMPIRAQYDEIVRNWKRMAEVRDRRLEYFVTDAKLEDRTYGNQGF